MDPEEDPEEDEELVALARGGDERALPELFRRHQARLLRMVELRLDPAVRRRVDPADVLQEAWIEVGRRLEEFLRARELPLRVWLRLVTAQALAQVHRRHLGTHMRDALREVRLDGPSAGARGGLPSVSAANVAELFVASMTSPTRAARREELRARVLAALEELDDHEREIVVLRHFEGLSNEEAAAELALTPAAASKRFLRALVRLRPALRPLEDDSLGGAR